MMPMVDLIGQYHRLKEPIDRAINDVLHGGQFINGVEVSAFAHELSNYVGSAFVIPCANGTDALQIALMALGLQPGDEVIVPSFTYVASAEVIALLGCVPVLVDVHPDTYNIDVAQVWEAITPRTRAVIPVHLFGQCAPMEELLSLAQEHDLYVVEDNAQSLGACYTFADGTKKMAGTMGTIGCTSFFPSKNLGCFGDGGALFTEDERLAQRIKMIANHGQEKKYHHKIIGCNSRLDTLQAAILRCKLPHLDAFNEARRAAAHYYNELLTEVKELTLPCETNFSTHVYHQYTLRIAEGRDALRDYLQSEGISSMVYYPIPLHCQEAFCSIARWSGELPTSTRLSEEVLSLPMHTELTPQLQDKVARAIHHFYTTR